MLPSLIGWCAWAITQIPFSLPDLFVLCGFAAIVTGLWITFGAGPTCDCRGCVGALAGRHVVSGHKR
jgi:hypothetical protein